MKKGQATYIGSLTQAINRKQDSKDSNKKLFFPIRMIFPKVLKPT